MTAPSCMLTHLLEAEEAEADSAATVASSLCCRVAEGRLYVTELSVFQNDSKYVY